MVMVVGPSPCVGSCGPSTSPVLGYGSDGMEEPTVSEKRKEQTNPNDIFWDDKWGCKIKLKNGDTYYVFWRNID